MTPEFSRPIDADDITNAGRTWVLEATPDECALLAQRFGILEVTALTAKVKVKPMSHGDLIRVNGQLTASVVQACVVTLVPVAQQVQEEFDLSFSPSTDENGVEVEIDMSVDDPPEPILDGKIDLGEIVAEYLALGLDPFPRADGAEFTLKSDDYDDDVEVKQSPFAALSKLAKKNL